MKRKSQTFLTNSANPINTMNLYCDMGISDSAMMFEQPCLGLGISSKIYQEFLFPFPEKEAFMQMMSEQNGDWNDMIFLPSKNLMNKGIKSYCKEEGIREFMESGRVKEFPEGFYSPLSMEVRKKVLLRIIQLVREGYITYYFLPDAIQLPSHIYVYWNEIKKKIIMNQVGETGISQVQVEELGIYRAFQYFIEYMERKEMFPDREEVLRKLEEVRKEYW